MSLRGGVLHFPSPRALNAHRPRRIGLRRRDARHRRQRGSARDQMQKISAGKFHFEPPTLISLFDHLVGAGEQRWRNFEAERLRYNYIDDQVDRV